MCTAVALISLATSAASQVLTFQAQNQMLAAEGKRYVEAMKSAGKSLADQQAQENLRLQQLGAEGAHQQLELRREAMRAKGSLRAEGRGGMSEELLLADVDRQKQDYSDIVASNVRDAVQQSYWNKVGQVSDAQSRANAYRPTGGGGSLGALGLGVLGAGLDTLNTFKPPTLLKPTGSPQTAALPKPFDPGYNGRPNR